MGRIARNSILMAAMLALANLLLSPLVMAAGLGRLNVLSSLGEPLRAEIELTLQPGEADLLTAKLASNEAFRQANVELNSALLGVKFAIERRPNGRYVVSMTSAQPMNEPFIDVLVELNAASGRLVREYTFLLDPPEYRGPAIASVPAIEPPVAQAPQAVPSPVPQVSPPGESPITAVPTQPPAVAQKPEPAGTYEVKRGDTLAKIARQHRQEGVSLQQMLVALYRSNPQAFDGENMNRLRAGRILNLPEQEAIAAVSAAEARRLINTQSADYAQYRRSLGAAVAEAPVRGDAGRQTSGRIGAPAEDKPAPKEPAKDQLRLTRPEDAKSAGKAAATAAARDDLAAKEKALKEASERIAMLEKNIAALKSRTGAELQQQARADKAEASKAAAPKPEAPKPGATKPEAAKPEAAKPEAPAASDTSKAAPPAVADANKAPDTPKVAAKPPPPPLLPAPGFVDELLADPMQLGLIGLVVLLLGAYAFYAVRKKRQSAQASSIIAREPSFANSMLAAAPGASIDAGAASADAGFGTATPLTAEAEEIDPVAEADVYMAYGRDAQAEEILKESLANDPTRQPVRLKLLEIYANRKDKAAFEATARDLHSATGGQGPEWEKAVALGLSIDPGNPLYSAGGAAGGRASEDKQALAQANPEPPDIVLDASPAEKGGPAPLDFDLDLAAAPTASADKVPAEAPAVEEAPAALDFDLDLGGDKLAAAEAPAAQQAPAQDSGMSIDFDLPTTAAAQPEAASANQASEEPLSIDFDLSAPEPAAEIETAPALDLSSIDLDLGSGAAQEADAAHGAQWQEVATKLDLAKAYHDMGDKDGARELLNEVLNEGDSSQQDQAKSMLETIG